MKNRPQRIAIVDGLRSPMYKASTELRHTRADDLGALVLSQLLSRMSVHPNEVDDVLIGNVAQPSTAANVARVIALKAGLPQSVPAATVHRNCASGMEALSSAAERIFAGSASTIIVGGVESMSNIPLLYNQSYTDWALRMQKAKTFPQRIGAFASFRPRFLKPDIGLLQGLTDPVSGLIMGLTAENLARDFHISRKEQDEFALASHQKSLEAQANGVFDPEIVPIPQLPSYDHLLVADNGPRAQQSMEALARLKPYFDKKTGTVTAGNSSQITDGAAFLLVMGEDEARKRGISVLGYLVDWAYAGLAPDRMGLGPVYAMAKVLSKNSMHLSDFDLFEINEAFAAQVLANLKAAESAQYCTQNLGLGSALGSIDPSLLNVNGGAIALGHPVGMTGTRLVLHLLLELRRRKKNLGMASLCIGGGQGAAFIVEAA